MNVNRDNETPGPLGSSEHNNTPAAPKDPNHEYWKIEFQYLEYLKRVKMDIRKMPPYQIRETKRAFYAGFGVNLIMVEQLSTLDDMAAEHQIVQSFLTQIDEFFTNEAERPNLILPGHMTN
jgi:hypothetical protein